MVSSAPSSPRIWAAALAAPFVAGICASLAAYLQLLIFSVINDGGSGIGETLSAAPLFLLMRPTFGAMIAFPFVALIAYPLWAVLHANGYTGFRSAMLAGAAVGLIAYALYTVSSMSGMEYSSSGGAVHVSHGIITIEGWKSVVSASALMSIAGSCCGLILWRIA